MNGTTHLASALARIWVRLYTRGMPSDLCEARRAEIDSDLWECLHECRRQAEPGMSVAAEIVLRTFVGIPDDIGWRLDASRERRCTDSRRSTTMSVSTGRLRVMGLGAIIGGALTIGLRIVDVLFGHPGRIESSTGNSLQFSGIAGALILALLTALTLLWTLGVLGLHMQLRQNAGRSGSAGFLLLLVGSGCITVALALQAAAVAFDVTGPPVWAVINLLMIPGYAVLIPIGFVVAGVRLPRPWRHLAVAVGLSLLAQPWLSSLLRGTFPSGALLFGSEVSSLVLALGATGIGYVLWLSTRDTLWLARDPQH
jgi:hypothetical protein